MLVQSSPLHKSMNLELVWFANSWKQHARCWFYLFCSCFILWQILLNMVGSGSAWWKSNHHRPCPNALPFDSLSKNSFFQIWRLSKGCHYIVVQNHVQTPETFNNIWNNDSEKANRKSVFVFFHFSASIGLDTSALREYTVLAMSTVYWLPLQSGFNASIYTLSWSHWALKLK